MKILIIDRLKELMAEEKLNQVKLAAKTGIKQNTISAWLRGKKEPNVTSLWLLADYFNVDIDYLVGRKKFQKITAAANNNRQSAQKHILQRVFTHWALRRLHFGEEYSIIQLLANFSGVFLDSPGVEGDLISVPQRTCDIKANLN